MVVEVADIVMGIKVDMVAGMVVDMMAAMVANGHENLGFPFCQRF